MRTDEQRRALGYRAYEARVLAPTRTWGSIGDALGTKISVTQVYAKAHAKAHGLRWPLGGGQLVGRVNGIQGPHKGAAQEKIEQHKPRQATRAKAYQAKVDDPTLTWDRIAERLGITSSQAREGAKWYALERGLAWPLCHGSGRPRARNATGYRRWTAEEVAICREGLDNGHTVHHIQSQIPHRSNTQVHNKLSDLRRRDKNVCACGSTLAGTERAHCDACIDKGKARQKAFLKKGLCGVCNHRPADCTMTRCTQCVTKQRGRAESKRTRKKGQKPPVRGLISWPGCGTPKGLPDLYPSDTTLVVDLFGGAGRISLHSRDAGFPTVYNDLHPSLGVFLRAVRDGEAPDILRLAQGARHLEPEELIDLYRTGLAHLDSTTHAAVFWLLALSVEGRDMKRCQVKTIRDLANQIKPFRQRAALAQPLLQDITIDTGDFMDAIDRYDSPTTIFVADPPFPGYNAMFEYDMAGQYKSLVERLQRIQGRYLLCLNSSRHNGELMAPLPFHWWRKVRVAGYRLRELLASNFEITSWRDVDAIDLGNYGIKT